MIDCGKKTLGGRRIELREEVKELLIETAKDLKGSVRRLFMARTVRALGEGGQRLAERELGWNRGTIRKGQHELEHGIICINAYASRGRKRSEEHLPNLLSDITAIVDGQSQADPQFRTNRLYTRLTATEVRRQLIGTLGYRDDELPTAETIATKLNELGYSLKKVAKSQPQKNCPKPMPSVPKSSTEMRRQMPLPTCYGSQWMPRQRLRSAPLHVEERVTSQPRLLTMTFSQKQL
jgi:hypothetical protein